MLRVYATPRNRHCHMHSERRSCYEIIFLSRLGFASILTPQPVVALAIRIVNGDSGNKVVVFTCGQVLTDLHRQRSVIAITQFDQIEVSLNIVIFRQVVTNPELYSWAQERRELGARGPALIEISRLLETQWEGQQAEGQCSEPGKTNVALLPQADEGGNGKTR